MLATTLQDLRYALRTLRGRPRGSEAWLPLTFTPRQMADAFRGNEYLHMIGRLKDGRL